MKATKSLLAMTASLVLILSAFFFIDAEKVNAAGDAAKLEISTVKGYAGDTVTVTVSLTENPGIAGGSFHVVYDKSVLTIKNPQTDVTTSNDAIPASAGAVCRKDGDGFVGYSFAGTENFTGTGTIFTIQFEIANGAAIGDSLVKFEQQEASNESLQPVDVQVVEGKVTVECSHAQTESAVTKEATCTEDGVKTTTCTSCGQTVGTETIPALGHNPGEYTVTKEATCTENGAETATCGRCGQDVTREIPAQGHNFGEYIVTREASDTEDGELTATCTVDGTEVKKAIPATKKEDFQVLNSRGEAAAEYTEHSDAIFIAVGQGMNNEAPQAGDVRYVPSEWKLGSASGSWTSEPYSATVVLGDKGDYTVTVTYKRQIFDGAKWNVEGKTYTSTTSILVKEQDDDDEPAAEPTSVPAPVPTQEAKKQDGAIVSPKTGESSGIVILLATFCGVSGAGAFGALRKGRGRK